MEWIKLMSIKPMEICVLGGGSFGTALSHLLGINGHCVNQWMRDPKIADSIINNRENPKYFPNIKLNENIHPILSIKEAVENCPLIFVSIPSKAFRTVLSEVGDFVEGSQLIVTTTKGIEKSTFKTMAEIICEETCLLKIGALSGPNLAGEIMENQLTGTVIASKFDEVIYTVQNVLASSNIRVYGNRDLFGVELGGTLKNIYAVASGLISALGMGENTRSLVITRGLAEMSRFAHSRGADAMTFIGLAGMGDLIATCSSNKSRNFQIGYQLGKGLSLKDAIDQIGQVAEGVGTIEVVHKKAVEENIRMPILAGLYAILFENKSVKNTMINLMSLTQTIDVEFQTGIN